MSENLLEVTQLTKVFTTGFLKKRQIQAVDNVSFGVPKDRAVIMTLAGESGSGKSTIAKILLLLIPPTSGTIFYNDKNIQKMSKPERLTYRREVQAIFQDPYQSYNPFYKIDRTLELPLKKLGITASKQDAHQQITEILAALGLRPEEILGKYPHQLSGGERQRVMLARAFLLQPKIIIADEPVSMIDASLRATILKDILRMKEALNLSFIYITHDLSTAYTISDSILILFRGSIVEKGDMEKVIKNPIHPYLQELVSSVPIPDPQKRWKDTLHLRVEDRSYREGNKGCKYVSRCSKKGEKCRYETPPMVEVDKGHYVACYQI